MPKRARRSAVLLLLLPFHFSWQAGSLTAQPEQGTLQRSEHSGFWPFYSREDYEDGGARQSSLFGAMRFEWLPNGDYTKRIFPVFNAARSADDYHLTIYPLLFDRRRSPDQDYDVLFPFYGWWRTPEGEETSAWPLLHVAARAKGPFWQFPALYWYGSWDGGSQQRFGVPFAFDAFAAVRDGAGSSREFGTLVPWGKPGQHGIPLAKFASRADGSKASHVFPFFYAFEGPPESGTSQLLTFLYADWRKGGGEEGHAIPPLLTWWRQNGKESYVDVLWPLVHVSEAPWESHVRVLPFYAQNELRDPDAEGALLRREDWFSFLYWRFEDMRPAAATHVVPPLLTWWWRRGEEHQLDVLWPFVQVHDTLSGAGLRALPFYGWTETRDSEAGGAVLKRNEWFSFLYLRFEDPGAAAATHVVPPLLTWWSRRGEEHQLDLLWPLVHAHESPARSLAYVLPFYWQRELRDPEAGGAMLERDEWFSFLYLRFDDSRAAAVTHVVPPLLTWWSRRGEESQLDLLWPFVHADESPVRSSAYVLPFYWQRELRDPDAGGAILEREEWFSFLYLRFEDPGAAAATHVVPPLLTWWSRRGEERQLDLLWPLVHDYESPARSSAYVLPFYWQRELRDPDAGGAMLEREEWFSFLYLRFEDPGAAAVTHVVPPLLTWWSRRWEERQLDVFWPFIHAYESPVRSLAYVFPFYGRREVREPPRSFKGEAILERQEWFSIFYWRFDQTEPTPSTTHVFPGLFARYKTAPDTLNVDLLWPLFHYERSPDSSSLRAVPFYWRTEDFASGRTRHTVPPLLAGFESAPEDCRFNLFWPLIHYSKSPEASAVRMLPFYWAKESPELSFLSVAVLLYGRRVDHPVQRTREWLLFPLGGRDVTPSESVSWLAPVYFGLDFTRYSDPEQKVASYRSELTFVVPSIVKWRNRVLAEDGDWQEERTALHVWPLFGRSSDTSRTEGTETVAHSTLWPFFRHQATRSLEGTERLERTKLQLDFPWPLVHYGETALSYDFQALPFLFLGSSELRSYAYLYPLASVEHGQGAARSFFHSTSIVQSFSDGETQSFRLFPALFQWETDSKSQTVTGPLWVFRYRESGPTGWVHLFPVGFGAWDEEHLRLGVFPFYYRREYGPEKINYWPATRFFFLWSSFSNQTESYDSLLWKVVERSGAANGDFDFRVLHRLVVNRSVQGQREILVNPLFDYLVDEKTGKESFSILKFLYRWEKDAAGERHRVLFFTVASREGVRS